MKIELSGHYGYRRLLMSSLPSMAMMIIASMYSIVDGIFVSNYVGLTPFAGLNLVWPAIVVIGAMGFMVGTGGSAIISMMLGQRDLDKANRTFTSLVAFIAIVAVVFAVPMYIFMPDIVSLLGANTPEISRNAVIYGRICSIGLPAYMLQVAFQSFFMAAEKPELGTKLSIASGITNIALDALFIIVFKWGLAGAAAASMIGCAVGGFFPVWYFKYRRKDGELRLTEIHFDKRVIAHTCLNGSSEYIGNVAFSLVSICYNLQLIKYYGEAGIAAYSVIMYIGFIFAAIYSGYNLTVGPVVAFNYGAGNTDELKSLLRKSIKLLFALGAGMIIMAQIIAKPASMLFVGHDAATLELTVKAVRIYMFSFLISGVNMFVSAWFTGLGNGPISAVSAFSRSLIFELGAVFTLPLLLGADGIWFSVIYAEAASFILCMLLLYKFRKRYNY